MGHLVYGYLQDQHRADALDWLRRQAEDARQQRATTVDGDSVEHADTLTTYLVHHLGGDDPQRQSLVRAAMQYGTADDRSAVSYMVRTAITRRGIAGAPGYLEDLAAQMCTRPGQETRAVMVSCLATVIDPSLASLHLVESQRRRFIPPGGTPTRRHPPGSRRSRR